MKKKVLILASLISMAACTKQSSPSHDVQQTVDTNHTAKDHNEWEMSENHPEQLFNRWRENHTSSAEVCAALSSRSDAELTIFEEEIHDPQFSQLLTECRSQLENRISAYWVNDTATTTTPNPLLNFTFASNVQLRDTSRGYRAWKGDVGPKEVVLTFDDGPHAEYTEPILNTLRAVNAKAIFFSMGNNAQLHPELLRKVAEGGHAIGSHSMTHRCLPTSQRCQNNNNRAFGDAHALTVAQAIQEIAKGHKKVFDAVGWVDSFFRFPYGEASPELRNFLNTNGMAEFSWSIDSNDWQEQTSEHLVQGVLTQLAAMGRGIILFHDVQHRTAVNLPQILRALYDNGYSPVLLRPMNGDSREFPTGLRQNLQ